MTTSAFELSKTIESVQVGVSELTFCSRHHLILPLRVSMLISSLNTEKHNPKGAIQPGINRYPKSDVVQACINSGMLTRGQVYEAFRINEQLGNPFFEEYDKNVEGNVERWMHVKGSKAFYRWVARSTEESNGVPYRMPQNGIAVFPMDRIDGKTSKRDWNVLVYEVLLLATAEQPISRASICAATGISHATQRRYDHEINVIKSPRFLREWIPLNDKVDLPMEIRQISNVYHVTSNVEIERNRGWRLYVQHNSSNPGSDEPLTGDGLEPKVKSSSLPRCIDIEANLASGIDVPTLYSYPPQFPLRPYQRSRAYYSTLRPYHDQRTVYVYSDLEHYKNVIVPHNANLIRNKNPFFEAMFPNERH